MPAFHLIERSILKALSNKESVQVNTLVTTTSLSIDQIRRGIEWLKFKNLVSVIEPSTKRVHLASEGIGAARNGLPERRLLNAVKEGKVTIAEVLASGSIKDEEVNAAIAGARRNQWIRLIDGKLTPDESREKQSPEERFLANLISGMEITKLTGEEKDVLEELKSGPIT